MRTPRRRAQLIIALIAVLSVPVLLGLVELGCRVFKPHLDPLAVFVASPQLRSDTQGENTGGMFEFDPLLTWRLKANLRTLWWDFTPVTTNGQHLRLDREIGPKAPGSIRVVCLGDSVTFGYRVPVAFKKETPGEFDATERPYFALLEEKLRAQFPGKTVEVLPLACPGYTSRQGLEWLQRDLALLAPDVVTACFGFNDVRVAGAADRETFPATPGQVTARRIISSSQGLLHLAKSMAEKRSAAAGPKTPEPRSNVDEYVAHFLEMSRLCRERKVWFGVILPVYRDENADDKPEGQRMAQYREALRANALANQIPYVELRDLYETNHPQNDKLFGERIHPNAAGHRYMAEQIAPLVIEAVTGRLAK